MNIVCATDDNFVQHCCVMLVSLLLHNKDVTVYVLTEGLTSENQRIIQEEVQDKHGEVVFCNVDSKIVERFPMPTIPGLNHISRATYYRLLIPALLPETVKKAIYLDCDIVINESLEDLWKVDLTNNALAASLQIGAGYEARRLKYPMVYGYFNAGMNVINLGYWRENNISKKLISYIEDNYEFIKYHDQDTLNAVLYEKTVHILPKWNMTFFSKIGISSKGDVENGKIVNDYELEKENVCEFLKHPSVLHFASRPKPWQEGCRHPLANLYFYYVSKTLNFNKIKRPNIIRHKIAVWLYKIRMIQSNIIQLFVHTDPTRK